MGLTIADIGQAVFPFASGAAQLATNGAVQAGFASLLDALFGGSAQGQGTDGETMSEAALPAPPVAEGESKARLTFESLGAMAAMLTPGLAAATFGAPATTTQAAEGSADTAAPVLSGGVPTKNMIDWPAPLGTQPSMPSAAPAAASAPSMANGNDGPQGRLAALAAQFGPPAMDAAPSTPVGLVFDHAGLPVVAERTTGTAPSTPAPTPPTEGPGTPGTPPTGTVPPPTEGLPTEGNAPGAPPPTNGGGSPPTEGAAPTAQGVVRTAGNAATATSETAATPDLPTEAGPRRAAPANENDRTTVAVSAQAPRNDAAATEATTEARPSRPAAELPTAVRQVGRAVVDQVERGGGETTIRLDPPELGTVTIRVRHDGGNVDVDVVVQRVEAAQLLESHKQDLSAIFQRQGMDLQLQVGVGADQQRQESLFGQQGFRRARADGSEFARILGLDPAPTTALNNRIRAAYNPDGAHVYRI